MNQRLLNTAFRSILFAQLLAVILTSCYTPRYVYGPLSQNVPILEKKGDTKLAVYYSNSITGRRKNTNGQESHFSYNNGLDVQTGWAFGKKFSLMVNQFFRDEKNSGNFDIQGLDSSVIRYHRSLTEIGLGRYWDNPDKHLLIQLYAGYGLGLSSFHDNGKNARGQFYNRFHQARIIRFFLQPSVTILARKTFRASFSIKMNAVRYDHIKTDYSFSEQDSFRLDKLGNSRYFFIEPAVTNTFGFKNIPGLRLEFQFVLAELAGRQFLDYRSFNFALGVMMDLGRSRKRR